MGKRDTTARPAEFATRAARDAGLALLAHHLAEVLRIARLHPDVPGGFYNDLADAWNNFENNLPSLARLQESEAHIVLALRAGVEQRAERGGGE